MRFADYSILGSDWGIWTLLGGMTAMLGGVVKKRTDRTKNPVSSSPKRRYDRYGGRDFGVPVRNVRYARSRRRASLARIDDRCRLVSPVVRGGPLDAAR